MTTSFVTDELCFNVIYYATVGLYYLNLATILEVLVPLCQNQIELPVMHNLVVHSPKFHVLLQLSLINVTYYLLLQPFSFCSAFSFLCFYLATPQWIVSRVIEFLVILVQQ